MAWIYAKDPACITGLSPVLCQPHLPLAWPKHRGCAQQEMGWQSRRTELSLQGLNVINENIWAGLSTAYPNKQGAELIFHKEYKFIDYLEGGTKLLSAVSGLGESSEKFISTWADASSPCKLDLFQVLDSPLLPYWYKHSSSFDSCPYP